MNQYTKKKKNIKRIVFIGGKQIGVNCLKRLLKYNIIPELVVANSDDNGTNSWHDSLVKFCSESKLNIIKGRRVKDKQIIKAIKKINPEIIFCIGSTEIIPNDILKVPKLGCLNIHPALLPKYQGRYSTVHAIFNGEKSTGVTIHWMDSGIDSGPIISQKKINIKNTDTAKILYDKFTKVGEQLFTEFIKKWLYENNILSTLQNKKNASFYSKRLPNDGQIDWNWTGKKIFNFIRAMTFEPFPPVSFKIGNKKMVIVDEKYFKGYR
ncbi:MAG: methionyl-tRNA formyltransferase [Patescibacteria group bacterium]|nr:methionyl-tRNA formyltransferase [Patescibacteria group bacterium]